jgi:hypothetical protein
MRIGQSKTVNTTADDERGDMISTVPPTFIHLLFPLGSKYGYQFETMMGHKDPYLQRGVLAFLFPFHLTSHQASTA